MIGLLGKKLGMTHVYDEHGRRLAVTAIQAGPCTILQIREPKRHGYHAIQLGFEPVKESALTKPELGQFKKAGHGPFRHVREIRLRNGAAPTPETANAAGEWAIGQQLTVELFQQYELVDVTGSVTLPQGTEMVMPGDNIAVTVELIQPVAMEKEQRFAVREGGKTVGAGVITEIVK